MFVDNCTVTQRNQRSLDLSVMIFTMPEALQSRVIEEHYD